jgi:hypothetical protein
MRDRTTPIRKHSVEIKVKERDTMKRALGYVAIVVLAAMASVQVITQASPLLGNLEA